MSLISEKNKLIVQAIRGGGCLFICLNHCSFFNKYSFGEIGVEFFVIMSGFLTAINASGHDKLRENYLISKIKKIMPLYWIVTLAVYIMGCIMPQLFFSMDFNITNLLYSLLLIPGHTFYLYPGWTLTYFFIFYITYCIADKVSNRRDVTASIIILILVMIGFVSNYILPDNILGKYTNPILLEFVYGIVLNDFISKNNCKNRKRMLPLVVVLILILFFDYNKYMGPRWLFPSLLTCVVIFFLYSSELDNKVIRWLAKIGDISFTIYILHPIIIRPVDKVCTRINGFATPLYFLGVNIGLVIVVWFCASAQSILKKIHVV